MKHSVKKIAAKEAAAYYYEAHKIPYNNPAVTEIYGKDKDFGSDGIIVHTTNTGVDVYDIGKGELHRWSV